MNRDLVARRLVEVAADLACRVRDDDPADVHRWLEHTVPPEDRLGLIAVMAALIPVDATIGELLAWVDWAPASGIGSARELTAERREMVRELTVERFGTAPPGRRRGAA